MEVALAGDIDELAGRFDAARARGASEAAAEIKAAILACVTPETRQIAYAGDIAMYVRACMGAMTAAHDRWMLAAENKRMERIALVDALVTVKLMAEGKVPVPAEAFTGEPEEADALNAVAALLREREAVAAERAEALDAARAEGRREGLDEAAKSRVALARISGILNDADLGEMGDLVTLADLADGVSRGVPGRDDDPSRGRRLARTHHGAARRGQEAS